MSSKKRVSDDRFAVCSFLLLKMPMVAVFVLAVLSAVLIGHMESMGPKGSPGGKILYCLAVYSFANASYAYWRMKFSKKSENYFLPIWWVRAELPIDMYPRNPYEFVALEKWARQTLDERASRCAQVWQIQVQEKELLQRRKNELDEFLAEERPTSEIDLRNFRIGYDDLASSVERKKKYLANGVAKQVKQAEKRFYRAWDVFKAMGITSRLGLLAPDRFLGAAKVKYQQDVIRL